MGVGMGMGMVSDGYVASAVTKLSLHVTLAFDEVGQEVKHLEALVKDISELQRRS